MYVEKQELYRVRVEADDGRVTIYEGTSYTKAEESEACAEMVTEICNQLNAKNVDHARCVWEILEENGHTPEID